MDENPTLQQILDNLKRQVAILADRVDMFITLNHCSSPLTPAMTQLISSHPTTTVAINTSVPPVSTTAAMSSTTPTLPLTTSAAATVSPTNSLFMEAIEHEEHSRQPVFHQAVAASFIVFPPPTVLPSLSCYPSFTPMQNNVHYQSDVYYSTAALFKALGAIQNSSWHTKQKGNGAHNVFVEMRKLELERADTPNMFAEKNKLKWERKILIFDPDGDIFNAKCFFAIWYNHVGYLTIKGHGNKMFNKFGKCISDLEDKVDLEGMGNDTTWPRHATRSLHIMKNNNSIGY